MSKAGSEEQFFTYASKSVLDEETTRVVNGLTALVAIGMSGAGTLDEVAGPMGEALIMAGIGPAGATPP